MSSLAAAGWKVLDYLDQIPSLAFSPWFWVVIGVVIVGYFAWGYLRPRMMKPVTPQRLLQESARKLAEAIDSRDELPLRAYRLATEAHTLAQNARETAESPEKLSKLSGVNVGEYEVYTRDVLTRIEQNVQHRLLQSSMNAAYGQRS